MSIHWGGRGRASRWSKAAVNEPPVEAPSLPTFGAMPTVSQYADSPLAGYRVIGDAISLEVWGLSYGTATSGDGVAALDDNTGTGSNRDQLLKFAATTGESYVAEKLRYCAHNGEAATSVGSDTSLAAGFYQMEFLPVVGECVLWAGFGGATEEFRVGIADAGDGKFFFTLNSAVIGAWRAYGVMTKVRFSWDAAGNFVVQSKTSGAWRTEFSGTDTAPAAITNFLWGCLGRTKATDIRIASTAISDTSFAEIDKDFLLSGSGTRDTNQTEAAIALVIPDGLFSGMTQARIRWAAGSDPSGGTAGSWAALSGKVQSVLGFALDTLTAGTAYSYQFEIGDVSGNVLYTSDAYQFRTLAAAGASAAAQFRVVSCYTQPPKGHPYSDEQYVLDSIGSDYIGTFMIGDHGYESNAVILESDYMANPPETADDFEQKLREFTSDIVLDSVLKAGLYWGQLDDHEWINDGDATHKPGGSNQNTLANDWASEQSLDGYGALVTLSDLYTAGTTAFDAWWTNHWLDKGAGRYQKKIHGEVEFIFLDTRTERLPGSSLWVSATQLTWIQDQITALAGTTKMVLFVAQAAVDSYTAKASEGWRTHALTQYRALIDYCVANIPSDVLWGFVTGDDHVIYNMHQQHATVTNPTMPANFLGEVRSSGACMSYHNATVTSSLWALDDSGLTATNPFVRSSGVLFDVPAGVAALGLSISVNGTEQTYDYDIGAPAAIADLAATGGDTQVDLTWTVPDAGYGVISSYSIERSLDGSTGWTQIDTSATNSYSNTGLTNGTPYYYRVFSTSQFGTSAASNVDSATPAAGISFPSAWTRIAVVDTFTVTGTHTNFPVLLDASIMATALATADDGGGDLRFSSDSAGSTRLACEVVDFDTVGGTCEIHVKVPSFSPASEIHVWSRAGQSETQPVASDTYGSQAVWSDYLSVHHFADTPVSTAADSTANGVDITSAVSAPAATTGKIGSGVDFGAGENLQGSVETIFNGLTTLSVQGWIYRTGTTLSRAFASQRALTGGAPGWEMFYAASSGGKTHCLGISVSDGTTGSFLPGNNSGIPADAWTMCHGSFTANDASGFKLHINGAADLTGATTGITSTGTTTTEFAIGAKDASDRDDTAAILDEVRTRVGVLSTDWIAAEYANQNNPATFAAETAI